MRSSRSARLFTAAAACAVVIAMAPACSAGSPGTAGQPGADPPSARLSLPDPHAPNPVGMVSLHLIDRSRRNPFAASPPFRELMVSVWYPARHAVGYPLAPYMLPGAAARFGAPGGHAQQLFGVPPGKVSWAAIRTIG